MCYSAVQETKCTAVQYSAVQCTVQYVSGPHHHIFRRFHPITQCPEPEDSPDHEELEPHDEQDGVHEQS